MFPLRMAHRRSLIVVLDLAAPAAPQQIQRGALKAPLHRHPSETQGPIPAPVPKNCGTLPGELTPDPARTYDLRP